MGDCEGFQTTVNFVNAGLGLQSSRKEGAIASAQFIPAA